MQNSVLFVCLGNICRSPAAEGVFRSLLESRGLTESIEVDSAGTSAVHAGELPDPRMRRSAAGRGYELGSRARQFVAEDFSKFTHIICMDHSNLSNVRKLESINRGESKARLFCTFCQSTEIEEVPDPYYGGQDGFEKVLDILEDGCKELLKELTSSQVRR